MLLTMSSCRYYTRDILFKADKEKEKEFKEVAKTITTPKNYIINKNDKLEFVMFTNKGEIMVDPTSEFAKQISGGGSAQGSNLSFLVQYDGCVNLPILGKVKVDSITLNECDSLLAKLYSKYYFEPFVKTKIADRKVYILGLGSGGGAGGGAGGGGGGGGTRAIILDRENITLPELLTQAGGPALYSFANRVKIIRGDIKNPTIFSVDITGWNSMQNLNLVIQPNDIIYIPPGRRIIFDIIRDATFYTQIITTLLTLVLITKL